MSYEQRVESDAPVCTSFKHKTRSKSIELNHDTGFIGRSRSRRRRPSEAMERLNQRSGPAPPEDGPFPGCPARLPRAMKKRDARPGPVRASPRRPARAVPKVRKGTSTRHLLVCNATQREARFTAPFRATNLIQTPAAAAAVTRASVRTRTA